MRAIHGGDIYRNHVTLDFSVNVNPLGMPKTVREAICRAVEDCEHYPDISAEKLKDGVSRMLAVPKEYLCFGNGASELFMAIIHGCRPKKTVIPVPSFYGYTYAAGAGEGEIIYYEMKEEDGFCLKEELLSLLTEETELLFLANPNNPVGNLIDRELLLKVLCHCREKGIYVVLDECFAEFCSEDCSMLKEAAFFPNLILVRAFTKIFSIPGVRLGYLVCSNPATLEKISRQLPEWNVSCFAQAAGLACTAEKEFAEKTADYVRGERELLAAGLSRAGLKVFSGSANFLFVHCEWQLYDGLLKKGILIRDCANFKGLSKGFYRIAVKGRMENEQLLQAINELWSDGVRRNGD